MATLDTFSESPISPQMLVKFNPSAISSEKYKYGEIAKVAVNKYQSCGTTNAVPGKIEMLAHGAHKAS